LQTTVTRAKAEATKPTKEEMLSRTLERIRPRRGIDKAHVPVVKAAPIVDEVAVAAELDVDAIPMPGDEARREALVKEKLKADLRDAQERADEYKRRHHVRPWDEDKPEMSALLSGYCRPRLL